MGKSSVTVSSPRSNSDAYQRTPTRHKGASNGTPNSLVRNFFARPRTTSPLATPTKIRARLSPGAVVLPQSKRSFTKWTPSPQGDEDGRRRSEPASSPIPGEDAPMLIEIKAAPPQTKPPPNAQRSPLIASWKHLSPTMVSRKHGLSPTIVNTAVPDATPTAPPKKRVRLSSPTQPLMSTLPRASANDPSAGSSAPDLALDAWTWRNAPPSKRHVVESMASYGLDTVEYPSPFYSNPLDMPARPKQFAGRVFHVKTNAVADLPDFEGEVSATPRPWLRTLRTEPSRAEFGWEFGPPPPAKRIVVAWCATEDKAEAATKAAVSQLAGPTQKNKYGFKLTQRSTRREQQNMSVLLLEVFGEYPLRLGWS